MELLISDNATSRGIAARMADYANARHPAVRAATELLAGYKNGEILCSLQFRRHLRSRQEGIRVEWDSLAEAARNGTTLYDLDLAAQQVIRLACSLADGSAVSLRHVVFQLQENGQLRDVLEQMTEALTRPPGETEQVEPAADPVTIYPGDTVTAEGWGGQEFLVELIGPRADSRGVVQVAAISGGGMNGHMAVKHLKLVRRGPYGRVQEAM